MTLIDTYHIATMGYNSNQTITIASLGIIYYVEIIEVEPEIDIDGGGVAPSIIGLVPTEEEIKQKNKKFKVKVTVKLNGETIVQEKYIEKKTKPKVEDLKLNLIENKNEKHITIDFI